MAKQTLDRKTGFRVALALKGLTAQDWARQNGITPGHLSQVLSTDRASVKLTEKIDAFISSSVSGIRLAGSAA